MDGKCAIESLVAKDTCNIPPRYLDAQPPSNVLGLSKLKYNPISFPCTEVGEANSMARNSR